MAYHRRYFGIFTYSFAVVFRAIEYLFSFYVDPRTIFSLDGLSRAVRDAPGALSRMRSYMARALKHDCYTAGYFDPGRSFA